MIAAPIGGRRVEKPRVTKRCEWCAKAFTRRQNESYARFEDRDTCCADCGSKHRSQKWREDVSARVLALIRDYRGLPLSVEDLADELGMPARSLREKVLPQLVGEGAIAVKPSPLDSLGRDSCSSGLYYDPVAWAAAA